MAELRPYPFGALVARMLRELEAGGAIFDLPRRRFFLGRPGLDLGVDFHGTRVATPFGPAAGPQSQMAQNLVLSWLAGARVLELKTVQVNDRLELPRPCIDMATVGFNVEWSQELRLAESLEEYVKGAMLIEILVAAGVLAGSPPDGGGLARTVYDMSVGYDLAGLRSPTVAAFLDGMADCSALVDRLRGEIPEEFASFRDLEFKTRLSDTLTLSTFHGCPPDEIEAMLVHLLEERGLHAIVKLNPMLLGPERTEELLHERLDYRELEVPPTAFERDTTWEQAVAMCDRLGERAARLGRGFGVKFTNTLIVRNRGEFLPSSEEEMYLSGPPLHVLAMDLVARFRAHFGDRFPISFSAGIDRKNFADAVSLGLVPVTVCSDLLKAGGYGRAQGYFDELCRRMEVVGATTIDEFCLATAQLARAAGPVGAPAPTRPGGADRIDDGGADLAAARLENTRRYNARLADDRRYSAAKNSKPPRKIGSALELFDCVACDKCVPACPNGANFSFHVPPREVVIEKVRHTQEGWSLREEGTLEVGARLQYGNFADFCNDCGNCDVFCPEDGGPYLIKPRFFGHLEDWRASSSLDGFHFERSTGTLYARMDGVELRLREPGSEAASGSGTGSEPAGSEASRGTEFEGPDFAVRLDLADPLSTLAGEAAGEVDLTQARILRWILDAVYRTDSLNYPNLIG